MEEHARVRRMDEQRDMMRSGNIQRYLPGGVCFSVFIEAAGATYLDHTIFDALYIEDTRVEHGVESRDALASVGATAGLDVREHAEGENV